MLSKTVHIWRRCHRHGSRCCLPANRTGRERGPRLAARRNTRRDSDGGGINSHRVGLGTFERLSCPRTSLRVAHTHVHDMSLLVQHETHFGVRVVIFVVDITCPTVDRVAFHIDKEEIIIIKIKIGILVTIAK